jgi:hypothetical protein
MIVKISPTRFYKFLKHLCLLVTRLGDRSYALNLGGLKIDRSNVLLSSTVTHDSTATLGSMGEVEVHG